MELNVQQGKLMNTVTVNCDVLYEKNKVQTQKKRENKFRQGESEASLKS